MPCAQCMLSAHAGGYRIRPYGGILLLALWLLVAIYCKPVRGVGAWRPKRWPPSAPLRRKNAGCLTVVGADSISARPGRRGRRPLRVILMLVAKVATPQSPSVTAPLGGEPLRADDEHRPLQKRCRGFRPRRGQYGRWPKSVKKIAALLQFLAFWTADHPFGVLRGE